MLFFRGPKRDLNLQNYQKLIPRRPSKANLVGAYQGPEFGVLWFWNGARTVRGLRIDIET